MAYEVLRLKLGQMKAAADLSLKQFRFMKVTAANTVNLSGLGELAIGVLQNKPVLGESAELAIDGDVSKVVADAAVAAGAAVSSSADGEAKTALITEHVLGVALEAAAGPGVVISVLLMHSGKV